MKARGLRRAWVEFGLVAAACLLVAAAVLGSGIAQSALTIPNPLAWLANGDGHVTQANPDTGRTGDKLRVAMPGDELQVTQDGKVLTVTNLTDNTVTVVDLATLSFSGTRRGNPGVEILLNRSRIYLADKAIGRVERLDELTAATVGAPLNVGKPLADAAISQRDDSIWLLDKAGQVIQTVFSDAAGGFAERGRQTVPVAGEKAVLVAHERGVTVMDPRGGVTQLGTGSDQGAQAPPVDGPLIPADTSPDTLVPAVAPEDSAVVIVHEGRVSIVDSAKQACVTPARPAVYRDLVYVPCIGGQKVIVLDRDGNVAAPPIQLPPGRPELIPHAGLLIINVIGADTGKVVKPDGSVTDIRTRDPQAPAVDPTGRPTAVPPSLRSKRPTPGPSPTRTSAPTASPTTATSAAASPTASRSTIVRPSTGAPSSPVVVPTTTRPPQPSDYTATNVNAVARPDGTIQVTWNAPPTAPASYRILRADTGEQLSTSDAAATSAIVSGVPLGQQLSFVVESVVPGTPGFRSAPSPPVSAFGPPGAPDIVQASIPARQPNTLTVRVSVAAPNIGGSPITRIDLAVTDGRGTRAQVSGPYTQSPLSLDLDIDCADINDLCLAGGGLTFLATLYNSAGAGPRRTATATIPGQAPFQYSQENRAYFPVQIVTSGLKCWNHNFTLQPCNANDGAQQWTPMDRGYVSAASNPTRACVTRGSGTLLRLNNGSCADDSRRWHRGEPGNLNHLLRNQENDRYCIFVSDPNANGAQVGYRNCQFNAAETFHYFLPSQPVGSLPVNQVGAATVADSAPATLSAAEGGLGDPLAVLLLVFLPLVARMTRRERR